MTQTIIHIAAATDDGGGYKTGASYPPTSAYVTEDGVVCYAYKSNVNNEVDCGYFRFDTSGIPDDATIDSATIEFLVTGIANPDGRNFVGDYYDFGGEASVAADWIADPSSGGGTLAFSVDIGTLTSDTREPISLQNVSSINKTGYTGIRIGISGGQPTGTNQVAVIAYENVANPGEEAILTVNYTEAGGGGGGGGGTLGSALPTRLPFSTGGNTYYVDSSLGSDSRTATEAQNPSTPWLTINKAINTVPLAGSIIIAKGTFTSAPNFGSFAISWAKTADTANPVTIKAHDDGCTIINSSPGTGPAYGAWISAGEGLRLEGITFNVRGDGGAHILIEGTNWVEFYRCRFIEAGGMMCLARGRNPGSGDSENLRWEACEFGPTDANAVTAQGASLDTTDAYYSTKGSHYLYLGQESGDDQAGALQTGTNNVVVANCVFYGTSTGRHIQMGPQFRNGFIVNNTFYYNKPGNVCPLGSPNCEWFAGTCLEFWDEGGTYKTADVVVCNNIIVEMQGHAAYGSGSGGTDRFVFNNIGFDCDNGNGHLGNVSDHFDSTGDSSQTLYVETKPDASSAPNSVTDPDLTDPTNRSWVPQAGSPAIAASLLDWTPTEDFDGTARSASAPTIGAFEVAAGSAEHFMVVTDDLSMAISTSLTREALIAAAFVVGLTIETALTLRPAPVVSSVLRLLPIYEGLLGLAAAFEDVLTLVAIEEAYSVSYMLSPGSSTYPGSETYPGDS